MKRTQMALRTCCSIVLILVTLLQSVPAIPAQSQPLTVADVSPLSIEDMPAAAPASPIAVVAERQVDAQKAHVEPTPVTVSESLPPGTIAMSRSERAFPNRIYLPLVFMPGTLEENTAVELVALRTRNAKVFQRPDGSGYAMVYSTPIHYRLSGGSWGEIDRDLVFNTTSGSYENIANEFQVQIARESSKAVIADTRAHPLFSLVDDDIAVEFSPLGGQMVVGEPAGPLVTYSEFMKGIDLQVLSRNDGIQWSYVLKDSSSVHNDLTLETRLYVEHCEILSDDETLVVDCVNGSQWHFAFSAYSEDETLLGDIPWRVRKKADDIVLQLSVPAEYLIQEGVDRSIIIQSSVSTGVSKDAYAESGAPGIATGDQFTLFLGYETVAAKHRTRIFAQFNLPSLPAGAAITGARASFYQYLVYAGAPYNTYACRVTQNWEELALTWNNQPAVADCLGAVTVGNSTGWKDWAVTNYVQAWYAGTPNYGFRLHAHDEYAKGGVYCSNQGWNSICQYGALLPYMIIDYLTPANPHINSGLNLSPSTQQTNENVVASFNVHNYGEQSINLWLRVTTNGGGDFAETNCTLWAGGDCGYNQSRSFAGVGSYYTCAQMNRGYGWENIPATGGGVSCRTLNIVTPADVRLVTGLTLTPNQFDHTGGVSRAQFTVQNYGGVPTTERLRALVKSGTATFAETGDVTLNPGTPFAYDTSQMFIQPGLYEVEAQHYLSGIWQPLLGNSNSFVRVLAPPPSPSEQNNGSPVTCGYAGEPVNTSTGNYFYDFTDLSEPTPGLTLAATRWYNSLDANTTNGPFGYGTSWTYNMTATLRSDKSALVRLADGHLAYFIGDVNPDDPFNLDGVYQGQGLDASSTLTRSGNTALLTTPDQMRYYFDASGRLVRVTHPHPAEILVIYDGVLPTQLVHSTGVTYTLTYSGSLLSGIVSSSGRVVTYTYSTTGDLVEVIRSDGSNYSYVYDENHRLTEARDPNGNAFVRNIYDTEGRVVRQYDQSGQESAFTYGAQITAPRVYTDALGNALTHIYDSNYYLVREVDGLGYTTVYTRDVAGNVLARRDKDGSIWRYTYDAQGNRLTETDPLNNTWLYTYDARNNLTSQIDPTGRNWIYEYDAQNHLVRTTDPLGHYREYAYDATGNLIWERDEAGAETRYATNDLGLRTVITDALGHVTRMDYDILGNQTVYTDANGTVALFFYDTLNRLERSIDPAGTVITFTYDAMGNLLAESNGLGQLRHYTYDVHDRTVAETDFNGHVTRYGYDALDRRTVMTDALGFTTVYTYNAVGNLVAERGKDGAVRQYEYDALGRQVRETDPLGRVTEYVYDAAGRQIEVRRPCATCSGGVAVSRTFYDAAGRIIEERDPRGAMTRYTHDAVGRAAIMTDAYGYIQTTTYDPAGRVIQETDPLGAITRYEYDLLGQVITTTNALGYQSVNAYDAVGRVIQTINERGYTATFVYDANDRVVATYDALGNVTRNTYDGAGRLIAVTDALSRTTTYTYDANGNRLTETNPRGHTTTTVYDALNRAVEVIEPAGCCGMGTRFTTYDAAGRVVQETDALGYTRVITYDVVGRRSTERSPLGYTTVYTYDVADNLVSRQEPAGAVWRFEYDANGNQTRQIDALGYVYSTEYDLLNRAVHEADSLGAVTTRQYDGVGRVVSQRDPRGATTRYTYDLLGRITQETDPLGYTRLITYDGAGNRVAEQDGRGFVTTYVYDALDREIAQTDPLDHSRYTLYDAVGQTLAVVDYKGYATHYGYDAVGNVIWVTDALSHTTSTEYDALNRPVAVTDALSQTTRSGYDVLGRVVSQTTALGHTTVYTYNAEGWQTARRDALDGVWLTNYDAAGHPVRETDPLGRETAVTYDALGRAVAQADALGRVTTLTYDPAGRLTAVTGPDGTAQRYTYDAVGNILTEQDGNGHITRYEYDLNGRLIRKTDALGRKWHYRYDAAGNLLETLAPSGRQVLQEYDALNRLAKTSHDGAQVLALAYDANGNRAVMTDTLGVTLYVYDALNRLIGSGDEAGSRVVLESCDAVGQRVSLTYPDGTVATYAYDADGNLSAVTAPDGQMTTYAYDALGRPTHVTQGNGVVVETVYDAVGNTLSIIQYDAAETVFASHTYTVDAADRRTQVVEQRLAETLTIDYTYDDLDRLIASFADDGRETHYTFDGAGNRTAMWGTRLVGGVTEAYTVTYTYNTANQLLRAVDNVRGLTTYAYDADGNRNAERTPERWSDYTYDADGRMIEARVRLGQLGNLAYKDGVYQQYIYDGLGRRARVATLLASDESLVMQRDYRYNDGAGGWDVLQTYDAQGESYGTYLYDRSLHRLAYWQGGDMGYLQNDGLGSVLGATAADGAAPAALMRYGDYGEELGPDEVLPTEDGYTGYERDAYTGLNYARHRYHDATTGTFLTVDPYPLDHQDVLDLHRYLYVQANPINNIDPLGLKYKCTGSCQSWGSWQENDSDDFGTWYIYLNELSTCILRAGSKWPIVAGGTCQASQISFTGQAFETLMNNIANHTLAPKSLVARYMIDAARFIEKDSRFLGATNVDFTIKGSGVSRVWVRPWGNSYPWFKVVNEGQWYSTSATTQPSLAKYALPTQTTESSAAQSFNTTVAERVMQGTSGTECGEPPQGMPTTGSYTAGLGIQDRWGVKYKKLANGSYQRLSDSDDDADIALRGYYGAWRSNSRLHTGIDIQGKSRSPVISTMRGIVTEAGYRSSSEGNVVTVSNSYYRTVYKHLNQFDVQVGEEVFWGTYLGEMENKGKNLAHLHYEIWIWKDGRWVSVDPSSWLTLGHDLSWRSNLPSVDDITHVSSFIKDQNQ